MDDPEQTRLHEFDETEWFAICHKLRPEVTHEEFHVMWEEFQAEKERRAILRSQN